jgi:hypothetical protein
LARILARSGTSEEGSLLRLARYRRTCPRPFLDHLSKASLNEGIDFLRGEAQALPVLLGQEPLHQKGQDHVGVVPLLVRPSVKVRALAAVLAAGPAERVIVQVVTAEATLGVLDRLALVELVADHPLDRAADPLGLDRLGRVGQGGVPLQGEVRPGLAELVGLGPDDAGDTTRPADTARLLQAHEERLGPGGATFAGAP